MVKVTPSKRFKVSTFSYRMYVHDDVIKWKHFPRYWSFVRGIHRSPVNYQHTGQWRGALMFSLICAWINGCVKNRDAGDLRRHRAYYCTAMVYRVLSIECGVNVNSSIYHQMRYVFFDKSERYGNIIQFDNCLVESTKTTSMEAVSIGVLEKI